jgi:hypothetical protein
MEGGFAIGARDKKAMDIARRAVQGTRSPVHNVSPGVVSVNDRGEFSIVAPCCAKGTETALAAVSGALLG